MSDPAEIADEIQRYLGDESALGFLREARAAATVRHPNVASVFHLGRTGSSYRLVQAMIGHDSAEVHQLDAVIGAATLRKAAASLPEL